MKRVDRVGTVGLNSTYTLLFILKFERRINMKKMLGMYVAGMAIGMVCGVGMGAGMMSLYYKKRGDK